ncbi:MAG: DUF3592 domain-containing protein [Lysobacteraceae bacterium]
MKRTSPLVLIAFFALFVSVGLAMLGFAGRAWWKSTQVEQWPSVEGELLERSLAENSDSDSTTWQVKVRYAYTVAGRRYEGDRIAFGYVGSSGKASHQAIYDRLMRGERVRVRYNPADPAEAALAHGLNKSTLMLAMFGLVWTGFTLGLMVLVHLGNSADTALIDRILVR